jgi:hypothetical protein
VPRPDRRRALGALLLAVGSLLLLASLFLGWYQFRASESPTGAPESYSISFFPGGGAQLACSSPLVCPWSATGTYSDPAARFPDMGSLYDALQLLLLTGGLAGEFGALLGLAPNLRGRVRWAPPGLAVAAFLLGVAGPLLVYLEGPRVFASDLQHGSPGPWATFQGRSTSGGLTYVWGPLDGWYLALLGAALLALGLALWAARARPQPKPGIRADEGPRTALPPADAPSGGDPRRKGSG